MLNDRDFKVSTYSNSGVTQHCPAEDYRNMLSGVVSATTKISKSEADSLVSDYEAKKSDAETMIELSKDFVNSSLRTGRKINLGGTENSNISIQLKEIDEATKKYPKRLELIQTELLSMKNQKLLLPHMKVLKLHLLSRLGY